VTDPIPALKGRAKFSRRYAATFGHAVKTSSGLSLVKQKLKGAVKPSTPPCPSVRGENRSQIIDFRAQPQ
jgi:hypothetical protein